jgi:chromosomal replication initiation ATPase DnaA
MLPTLSQIVQATCRHFEVPEAVIWQSRRGRGSKSRARSVAMYLCQETIRQLKTRTERDAALAATIERLKCDLVQASPKPVL